MHFTLKLNHRSKKTDFRKHRKISNTLPEKSATPQHLCISRSSAWRQHFVRSHPDATSHEKRALRLCCVGRGGESATPQPMNGMACRETLRRGGNFLGCRGRTIATVFEKSFCGTINIGGGCLSGVLFGR